MGYRAFLYKLGIYDEAITCLAHIKKEFWSINWLKSIWINYRNLPFKQAIYLPIIVSYNVKFNNKGKILIKGKVSPGIVSIGVIKTGWESNSDKTIFKNRGTFILYGRFKMHPGSKLIVYPNANIICGNRTSIGSMTKIICAKLIEIGENFRISWNGQIFDTDFHFLKNIKSNKIYKRIKPVKIGNDVFIGNSCTIGKGTILLDGCVVSCCSKVSGDFTEEGKNLLISGNPAKVVNKGYEMINDWFPKKESKIALELGE